MARIDSPIGELRLYLRGGALVRIDFAETAPPSQLLNAVADAAALAPVIGQLDEFFSGRRRAFDLDVSLPQPERFQARAQAALNTIGFGETLSYAQLAARAGAPAAIRAAGTACARNPLPIVLPCHRVLAAGGKLGGYAGGLWRKELLLDLERATGRKG